MAEGEKRIRYVDVTYGGEINTPAAIGYQYISTYEISEKKEKQMMETEIEETQEIIKTKLTNKKRITEQYPTADVSAVGYCFYTELPYAPILSLEIKIIDK